MTLMPPVETALLSADDPGLTRAALLLQRGDLVAFPTETVYGLGGLATRDNSVAAIFAAKQRPRFNPLILHVADMDQAAALVACPPLAQRAAEVFWPGPLTLVLPLRDGSGVSRLVTAGLDTVAVRVPRSSVAQRLLRAVGAPVAAPSANASGQISPTRAAHVLQGLGGRIAAVVDGGPCAVGLESTILGLAGPPTLLRPGGVPREALEQALGQRLAERRDTPLVTAPGQLRSHYAPRAQVRLNAADFEPGEARLGFGDVACDLNLSPSEDLTEAAANLFEYLHRLDAYDRQVIAVSPVPHVGLGVAINDRLSRAAAPR